jgi:hypothetical protein
MKSFEERHKEQLKQSDMRYFQCPICQAHVYGHDQCICRPKKSLNECFYWYGKKDGDKTFENRSFRCQ